MSRDSIAAMEDLDGARRDPYPHLLAQQRVWHRVIMPLDFDVVVEADPAFLPLRVNIGLDRQLLERGALDLLEQRTPAGPQMPRHAIVELRDQLPDGGVKFSQREEAPIAQLRDHPTSRNLNPNLNLRFILRAAWTCWNYCGAVVMRHLSIGAVHRRLVEARFRHARLQVVGNDLRCYAAEKSERPYVRADPVDKALRKGGFRIGVAAGAEHGDEQLTDVNLTGRPVHHLDGRARIVDEQPLAGDMQLPHGRRKAPLPGAVQLTVPRIAVTVGIDAAMLLPQQLQRHARSAQFAMDRPPVRLRSPILRRNLRRRIQNPLQ